MRRFTRDLFGLKDLLILKRFKFREKLSMFMVSSHVKKEDACIGMGDTNLTFTPEQYKFFLESCIEEVNRIEAKGSPSSAMFGECVSPLVDGLFQGYNATVLAYGQ
ncbi:kinesin-like protein KIN-4A isoform X1, partial [Tanacetum coccineum]